MKVLITGTIGSGKTTLVQSLQKDGHKVVHEQAKSFITEQKKAKSDLLPWLKPYEFQLALLERHVHSEVYWASLSEPTFFDTGYLDPLSFLRASGFSEPIREFQQASKVISYDVVFILEPMHMEHPHFSEEDILRIHEEKIKVYEEYGYTVIPVQAEMMEERKKIILNKVKELQIKNPSI